MDLYKTLLEKVNEIAFEDFKEKGKTLALAESCTGGLLAATITNLAGSSEIFCGSAVTYSNLSKERVLGVEPNLIATKGAVSIEVAEAMASGVRKLYQADVGLSITGIAGPGGGSEEKPVGTVYCGVSTEDETYAALLDLKEFMAAGDVNRYTVRVTSCIRALEAAMKAIQ